MIFLWVYLVGLTLCILSGIVTALVEKQRFGEHTVSSTAWASIVLYSIWWPFIGLITVIAWPLEKFFPTK